MDFKESIKHYAKVMGVSEAEAKGDAERTIAMYIKNEGYTREFAESTWIEDCEDLDSAELDKLEKQAKANGTTKVKAKRAANYSLEGKPKRERKPNEEKREIIQNLAKSLMEFDIIGDYYVKNAEIVNPEREITFKIGENNYSLTLTCHRKPKNG